MDTPPTKESNSVLEGIVEREEDGLVVLSPAHGGTVRRILHVNGYGGKYVWEKIRQGFIPTHQLLGCLELVRMGYEVALAEPVPDFYYYRKPLPHDLRLLRMARTWLGPEDIIYCGHNVLHWIPLLKRLGAIRCRVVSLLYAREPLDGARAHTGIIGLTPAAAEQARKLAPKARVANLGWGVDLDFFPKLAYRPEWFLSCGIANRDFRTLSLAAAQCRTPIRVICPGLPQGLNWPANVEVIDGGRGWHTDKGKAISVRDILNDHYPRSAAALIVMNYDPTEYTANGFTNLMEAMAVARPVIVTRTGALPGEIDVEKAGCGLHVPAGDPVALAKAMSTLASDPDRARTMGEAGRKLCETRYNMMRYAQDLHRFFESL
ncbi:MAG TPA: glycosyltransferase family 4 protein [Verrucomicrobiae bacterium]|nr:glycosyltransferase family 4 protein [Verrucomicrobiae bacterium]